MNDRFRFRIWDNEFKKYRTGLGINNGLVCTYNDDTCVLEQCTGLKDKNSKLIYEGDIVQMSYPYSSENKYIVKWGDCCWELWLENGFVYVVYEKMSQSMEVIGNIHENADLIKVGGK